MNIKATVNSEEKALKYKDMLAKGLAAHQKEIEKSTRQQRNQCPKRSETQKRNIRKV